MNGNFIGSPLCRRSNRTDSAVGVVSRRVLHPEAFRRRTDSIQLDKSLAVWTWPKFPMRHEFFQCSLNYAKQPPKRAKLSLTTFICRSKKLKAKTTDNVDDDDDASTTLWTSLQFPIWFQRRVCSPFGNSSNILHLLLLHSRRIYSMDWTHYKEDDRRTSIASSRTRLRDCLKAYYLNLFLNSFSFKSGSQFKIWYII